MDNKRKTEVIVRAISSRVTKEDIATIEKIILQMVGRKDFNLKDNDPSVVLPSNYYGEVFNWIEDSNDGIIPNSASGQASHAEGAGTKAIGGLSHAEGYLSTSAGAYSHAQNSSAAMGSYSTSEGEGSLAKGYASHAEGWLTIADNYAQHSQGHYNKEDPTPSVDSFNIDKTAFVIGNGSSDRQDAFVVKFNGTTQADGAYTTPAADYAEMFEWEDGNPNNEDRAGYIVELHGKKIALATGKGFTLGIVSAFPAIIGDNPMKWSKKYATDKWGRPILVDKEVTYKESVPISEEERKVLVESKFKELKEVKSKEKGYKPVADISLRMEAERLIPRFKEVEKTRIDKVYKISEGYDSTKTFVERTERQEWDAIGLLGKLLVRQDGTLKVGEMCSPKNGIATYDKSGKYYVMEVIDKSQALLYVK